MPVTLLAADPVLSTWLPPVLMLIGVSFLGVIMALAIRNHRHTEPRDRVPADVDVRDEYIGSNHAPSDHHHLTSAMPTLPAELLSSAQRLATSLDHKSHEIEELLASADHRIAELTALLEHAAGSDASHHATTAEFAVSIEAKPTATIQKASVAHDTNSGRALDPLSQAVYRLADSGRKPVEIARELHEQTGKVELILALRKC